MSAVPNILIAVSGKKEKLPLSITHPELASEAVGWDSGKIVPVSVKMSWKCKKGHIWRAPIINLLIGQGQIVPILAKVDGGTTEKPNLGVFAYARTEAVKFS